METIFRQCEHQDEEEYEIAYSACAEAVLEIFN